MTAEDDGYNDDLASPIGDEDEGGPEAFTLRGKDRSPILNGCQTFEDSIVISQQRLKKCRRDSKGEVVRFKKSVQTVYGDDAEYALSLMVAVMREELVPLDIRMEASQVVMDRILGKPRQEHIVGASQDKVSDVLSEQTRNRVEQMGEIPGLAPRPVALPGDGNSNPNGRQ